MNKRTVFSLLLLNIGISELACVTDSTKVLPPQNAGPMVQMTTADGRLFFIDQYEFPNQMGAIPEAEMDFNRARERCNSVGKRLCTMTEWKQACGGTRFPYGETYIHNRCYSNQQNREGHTSLMHGRTAQIASGQYKDCVTINGVFDMVGNLEEWVLDDWRGQDGNLAGGAWYSHWRYADCTADYSKEPDYRLAMDRPTDSAGVRCCWSEWSPTQSDIQADAVQKRTRIPTVAYQPQNELEVLPGIWMDQYEYPNAPAELPLVGVSWFEAEAYCKENNKSLCTVSQWEQACLQLVSNTKCNIENNHLTPSGHHAGCRSDKGIYDLLGNAWEWMQDDFTVAEFQHDPNIPVKEIRGGSYLSDSLKAQCRPTVGYPLTAADMQVDTLGFRCCRAAIEQSEEVHAHPSKQACPTDMRPQAFGCIDTYEFPNRKGIRPKDTVSLEEAKELCRDEGKHLCTANEWTEACSGSERRRWSYGNPFDAGKCQHAVPLSQGGSRPSGSYPDCQTPDGVFDMTGNVWEWTENGQLRGGNWNLSEGLGQCESTAKPAPHIRNDEVGFRCCANENERTGLLNSEK